MDAPLTLSVAPPPPAVAPPPVYLSPRRTTDEGAELMDSDDYADPTPPASPKLAPTVVSLTASAASPAVRARRPHPDFRLRPVPTRWLC